MIAPSSVLSNWEREFETFGPQLRVVKYHGSMDERVDIQDGLRRYLTGQSTDVDVILAPVTYFQKEKSDDRAFLRKFKYDYLVVDEVSSVAFANKLLSFLLVASTAFYLSRHIS